MTDASSLSARNEAIFFRFSLFTLKRILGEEGMRLVTDFHQEWAMGASPDRIEWEVLNRLHRVLNQALEP